MKDTRDRNPSAARLDDDYWHPAPPDSYSRSLDSRVQATEMPYGYTNEPPAADSGNYATRMYETKNQSRPKRD